MKTFSLLRDNRMSGPYSLAEMRTMGLRTTDLVWVEQCSTQWEEAAKVDELSAFVKPYVAPRYEPRPWPKTTAGAETVKLQPPPFKLAERAVAYEAKVLPAPARRQQTNALWIMALMAMLFFGAFVVKKLVDNTNNNTAVMTQPVAMHTPSAKPAQSETFAYHNAISTETVYAQPDATALRAAINGLKKFVHVRPVTEKADPLRTVADTELEVVNGTAHSMEKIELEVTWLKKNGAVAAREVYAVYNVASLSKKILVVPAAHNAQLKFKVTNITTAQNALPQVSA